jgi:RNA polymerase sigma-B factor
MTISALERQPSRQQRKTETARLFALVAETDDDARREELVEQVIVANIGVAQSIARRFRGRGIADDDLEQVAYLALTRAAQKFRPAPGVDFLTYAVPTMSGELKRHFRDLGWTVRPPRRVQEVQSRVVHAYRAGHEAGRPPSPSRLATELDLPEEEVREALAADGCFTPTSLDLPVRQDNDGLTLGQSLVSDDSDELRALDARLVLGPALRTLSDRDRRVLYLRFVEERSQSEIGEELGLSQMQVSRQLKRIMRDLRAQLEPEPAIA